MDDFPSPEDLAGDARRDFKEFYRLATPRDARLMDRLVMLHAAVVVGMNVKVDEMGPDVRKGVEKILGRSEEEFTRLRKAVRACPTFQRVSDAERFAIEKVAFQVRVPEG